MKNRPVILRIVALLMILVFSQNSGTGLFLHNLLHSKNIITEHPAKEDQTNKDQSYACTCIDDFLMPFDEAGETVCPQPVLRFDVPLAFFIEPVPFHTPVFSSLRGPPNNML